MMTDSGGYLSRPAPSGLADVVETILDRGLVVDAYARVSLLGIELVTVDARIVLASVETYLRYAAVTNRLDLWEEGGRSLADVLTEGVGTVTEKVASHVVEKKVTGGVEAVGGAVEAVADKAAEVAKKTAEVIVPGSADQP